MNISKKLLSIFLAFALFKSFSIVCNEGCASNHKKYLTVGAYSLLGIYSATQVLASIESVVTLFIGQTAVAVSADFSKKERCVVNLVFLGAHLVTLARLSLFGYLSYFSVKKVIRELKDKDKDTDIKKIEAKQNSP